MGISVAANFDRTLGFNMAQAVKDERSTREVTITVIEQTLRDRLARRANTTRMQVSGDLDSTTATHFLKGKQGRFDVDRWNSGYNALMIADVLFHKSSNVEKGDANDLKLIRDLLKRAKPDIDMQKKVTASEEHFNLATVVNQSLESLQTPANRPGLPKPKS